MTVCQVNKNKVWQFFDEVVNQGRLELVDGLVANDFIGTVGCFASVVTGPDGVRRFVAERRIACPELYLKIEDQIAEDDRVVTRWRAFGAETGPSLAPGSSAVATECAGITIIRLLAGKQVDAHTHCARGSLKEVAASRAAATIG
jgi:predicted SnoaL-like aldol condensation-catalyzing enzyme